MLRVMKEDLRLGMFVQSLEGSWFDHPFWKSRFLLTEQDDLRALQSSGVESIWIDPVRSLAPAIAHLAPREPDLRSQPLPESPVASRPSPARKSSAASAAAKVSGDLAAARTVLHDCKAAVGMLFAQVRGGDAGAIQDAAPVVEDIARAVERNPDALLALARIRTLNEYEYAHAVAVSALMINLARALALPPDYAKQAGTAGLFMDIGKALLPPDLLSHSRRFTGADWAEMRRHPQLGAEAVRASDNMSSIVADVCLHHHERYDGTGYPHRLRGDEISLFARMAAICDSYDAMISPRPHRRAISPPDAVAQLYQLKGRFDESLLTSFIKSIGIYPVGSLVRMESGTLACVVAQRRDRLTRPVVRIFYSIPQRIFLPVREVDLAQDPEPDRVLAREDPRRWGLNDWENFALTLFQASNRKRAA